MGAASLLSVVAATAMLLLLLVGNGPGIIPELLLLDIGSGGGGGGPVIFVDAVLDHAPLSVQRMMEPDFLTAVQTRRNKFEPLYNI